MCGTLPGTFLGIPKVIVVNTKFVVQHLYLHVCTKLYFKPVYGLQVFDETFKVLLHATTIRKETNLRCDKFYLGIGTRPRICGRIALF